jgi:tRNA (mo5U34)-methyltransferase
MTQQGLGVRSVRGDSAHSHTQRGVDLAQDRIVERIHAIEWYHVIEVAPGVVTPGRYDPKPLLDVMGFPVDLTGKTVLDIGAYDGFFTFEAERRGAKRVVALDRHPARQKGFALAHELLSSKAEYIEGSVYDISPERHGAFDVILFLGVLYHLRHPLLALEKIHRICREYVLVESHVLDGDFIHGLQHIPVETLHPLLKGSLLMQFYPNDELHNDWSNWWAPTSECLRFMIESCGYDVQLTGRWANRAAFRAYPFEFSPPYWY